MHKSSVSGIPQNKRVPNVVWYDRLELDHTIASMPRQIDVVSVVRRCQASVPSVVLHYMLTVLLRFTLNEQIVFGQCDCATEETLQISHIPQSWGRTPRAATAETPLSQAAPSIRLTAPCQT